VRWPRAVSGWRAEKRRADRRSAARSVGLAGPLQNWRHRCRGGTGCTGDSVLRISPQRLPPRDGPARRRIAVSRFAELETGVQEPIPRRRPPGGHLCLSPPGPVSAARPAATITAVAPTLPAISQPSSDCRSLLIVYLISFPQHSVGRYQIGGDDLHSTLSTRAAARDQDSA